MSAAIVVDISKGQGAEGLYDALEKAFDFLQDHSGDWNLVRQLLKQFFAAWTDQQDVFVYGMDSFRWTHDAEKEYKQMWKIFYEIEEAFPNVRFFQRLCGEPLREDEELDRLVWKIVTDDPIVVDISKYKEVRFYGTEWDVHGALKEAFGFPDYYGRNWDALWDLLSDFCSEEEELREVHIYGWNAMSDKMKELYAGMWSVFADAEKEYPNVKFILKT